MGWKDWPNHRKVGIILSLVMFLITLIILNYFKITGTLLLIVLVVCWYIFYLRFTSPIYSPFKSMRDKELYKSTNEQKAKIYIQRGYFKTLYLACYILAFLLIVLGGFSIFIGKSPPTIPQYVDYVPIVLGVIVAIAGFIVQKVAKRSNKPQVF